MDPTVNNSVVLILRHDVEGRIQWLTKKFNSLSQVVVLCVVSVCLAQKPYSAPDAPKPYSYQYAVADDYSKANFQKTESQDSNVRFINYHKSTVCTCNMHLPVKDNRHFPAKDNRHLPEKFEIFMCCTVMYRDSLW